MGASTILLEALCDDTNWDYAVFWKLRPQNPQFLSWEDGYYGHPIPRTVLADILYLEGANEILSFDSLYENASKCSLEVTPSCRQYSIGEGPVGKVAYMDEYCWLSFGDILASQYLGIPFELPDEWLPQILAGVKTILLIPILPNGVLQLGSLEEITEDKAAVDQIKRKFILLKNAVDCPTTVSTKVPGTQSSWSLGSLDECDESSTIIRNLGNQLQSDDSESRMKSNEINVSIDGQFTHIPRFLELTDENKCVAPPISLSGLQNPQYLPIKTEMTEYDKFSSRCLEDDCETLYQSYSNQESIKYYNSPVNSYVTHDVKELYFGGIVIDDTSYEGLGSIVSFPIEYDLHEAFGSVLENEMCHGPFDGYITVTDGTTTCLHDNEEFFADIRPSPWETRECRGTDDAEDLLEAVITNSYGNYVDPLTNISNGIGSSIPSLGQSFEPPEGLNPVVVDVGNPLPWRNSEAVFKFIPTGDVSSSYSTSSSSKSIVVSLAEKEQQNKAQSNARSKQEKKQLTSNKRKSRLGQSQRPRPRDRQLIQDRVKELRDLVPNGAKCSIDALLDKTIKHMLFLKRVTNQAEKLRKWVSPEENRDDSSSSENDDICQRETGWAIEYASELQLYPISVKDLEQEGHMLIEMLCDNQGLFLEIAQVIRRLDLTILKGVMVTRAEGTWAHFTAEASVGFQRIDIFWPLMQLLQRQRKHNLSAI